MPSSLSGWHRGSCGIVAGRRRSGKSRGEIIFSISGLEQLTPSKKDIKRAEAIMTSGQAGRQAGRLLSGVRILEVKRYGGNKGQRGDTRQATSKNLMKDEWRVILELFSKEELKVHQISRVS